MFVMEREMETAGESSSKLQQGMCSRLNSELHEIQIIARKVWLSVQWSAAGTEFRRNKNTSQLLEQFGDPWNKAFFRLPVCLRSSETKAKSTLQWALYRCHKLPVLKSQKVQWTSVFNGTRKMETFWGLCLTFLQVSETFSFLSSSRGRRRLWLSWKLWEQAAWTRLKNWTCWEHTQIVTQVRNQITMSKRLSWNKSVCFSCGYCSKLYRTSPFCVSFPDWVWILFR